jgi:lysophospholipase L1-like esterase
MFTINDDLSIYVTRGDKLFFTVTAEDEGAAYVFQPGDIVRFKVYGKKDATNVVLQKDFPVTTATEKVEIYLTEDDTKIGSIISKPKDYWYEVELNPYDHPQTIIGYDEDGAKVFRLLPEGRDLTENEPDIQPEDIPVVDKVLDMTSLRPVQNQAIARAVAKLEAAVKTNTKNAADNATRLDNLLSGATADGAEVVDIRVGADGETYGSAGTAVREQFSKIQSDLYEQRNEYLVRPDLWETMTNESDNAAWVSNKKYKRGTIKGVSVYIRGSEAQEFKVMFCKDNGDGTATWSAEVTGNGVGLVTVECDIYMDTDFYVSIVAPKCAFKIESTGNYFVNAIGAGTFVVPTSGNHYYHAYCLHMASFTEGKVDKDELSEVYGMAVKTEGEVISSDTEYADVIALPSNRIYRVDTSLDHEAFGLPCPNGKSGYGTLLKYRPYADSQKSDSGFEVYEYTVLRMSGDIERFFAYATVGETAESLVWRKYNTTANAHGLYDIADKSVVFIGDSIVEGYGASDYNGGEHGTSGHSIANNVKTWYRNTGKKCWANQMTAYLEENYSGVKACNNGIGGFTAQNIYDNLETLTIDDDGNRADIVFLSVGTNNRGASDKYGAIVSPLRKTIVWLLARGIQPIVLTNTPLYNTSASEHIENTKKAREVQAAIQRACEDAGVHCYNLLSEFYCYLWEHGMDVTTVMNDPLHPNDLGYEVMFNLIKKIVGV